MPTYSNPLYANGVPTYSNEVGALASVFQAMAPNPLRDLQIQGYANNARLHKLQGDVIQTQQDSLPDLAASLAPGGRLQDAASIAARGGNLKALPEVMKAASGMYGFRALEPGGLANVDPKIQATLSGAVGQNVANTVYGFEANQDRQTAEANQKNDTTMRGQDLVHSASIYNTDVDASTAMRGQNIRSTDSRYATDTGATTARRGQDLGVENATYNSNLNFLKPTAGRGGYGSGAGGSGSSTGKPPAAPQMNTATAKGVAGVFADSMPAGLPPEAEDDIKARTVYYVNNGPAQTRNNPRAAFVRARDEVVGDNQPVRDTLPIYGEYGDPTTAPVDAKLRPPLPEPVANIYGGPATSVSSSSGGVGSPGGLSPVAQAVLQGNPNLRKPLSAAQLQAPAPVAAPAAAPAAAPVANPLLSEAAAAIASGASRDAVIQRLRSMGVPDAQLQGL